MNGSFNDRVRQAVAAHFRVEEIFRTAQAWDAADCAALEGGRVWTALRDLARHGEVEALGQGRWRRLNREERPELKEIMWRLLRIHRVMTVEEMTVQSGASPKTAREFFETQMRLGLVRNEERRRGQPGRYRLVNDTGPQLPEDGANATKLRQLRARKKQQAALAALDNAFAAAAAGCAGCRGQEEMLGKIAAARQAVCGMEEG